MKTDYQILIIFGTTIPDTTCRQLKFLPHLTYASTLPEKIKAHEIGTEMNKKRQKPFVTLLIVTWRRIMKF